MSKIVFFDIDGTLLDHEKNIPDSTKKAVELLKENGIYVAIATGRAPFMVENVRKMLGIDSFVSFNGSYVVFENKVIYKNPLHEAKEKELADLAASRGTPLVFMNEKTMKASVKFHPYIQESLATMKYTHPDFDPSFHLRHETYQDLLFCKEEEQKIYEERFPEFRFVRWHPYSMDVVPEGGSKAEGIRQLLSKLGFQLEDAFAFGDGLNDVEMIQAVGTGVAMGNAVDAVKAHADLITKDVAEGGVYYGLKELGLI
ncbi:phosphatase [Weizmannia acidilactici]|uniref:Phosphatase n=1 Tax=Weizmannia acidilactici TaxID=2607726 RepID=A0A5J4JGL8_9BACI|nr:Cof-type HAD-IIB family hydrolase [Weizmannia acidilactici]GER68440.1 phosphatase [Weizmannia acidilactici]GER70841.1 phosphatase [Weizmannia acidilactici]GER74960.1 phosphatase [Weizmannia acidilactici]